MYMYLLILYMHGNVIEGEEEGGVREREEEREREREAHIW
jgi:hypothetical protein